MKVIDLQGKEHTINLSAYFVKQDDSRPRSKYHLRARGILQNLYPTQPLLEEVFIPGLKLYLDFYLPNRRVAVEVQGEQHYSFSSHFHTSKLDLFRQKKLDNQKLEWCELNEIRLVRLKYNGTDSEWTDSIKSNSSEKLED